ncbi:hypothetical protein OE749_11495 [Aestuariibacter sp. AA17]|uniref:Flagellar basal-body/hook protein C-terminal domain-containing protein n=1 Tax=Fluctibacter corallii TaxID=2984329 RepID=A0ABT3A9Q3_9ALTE|nr:flagellar basal body rod C-terminal domain-containing protein [Aestuariibacter sp. AA17]MCV2885317.1 hypothetical protein [Aestuariibacter sp. AA17]
MSELKASEIAKIGMAFERMRIEAASRNIANINVLSTSPVDVQPLFTATLMQSQGTAQYAQLETTSQVKQIYQPNNPLADKNGNVYATDINLASEMLNLSSAKRAYEANVKVYNSYKQMASKALEIGK